MHGCAAAFLRGHRSISTCASLACNCNAKVPKRHNMGTQRRPHAECRAMELTLYLGRGRQMRWTVDTRVSKHMVALNWCAVQSTADWKYSTFACPFHARVRCLLSCVLLYVVHVQCLSVGTVRNQLMNSLHMDANFW